MAYPAFDLSGKVTLVTGGNSGIGLGMAEALAQAGAAVAIWGTNAEKNRAAERALTKHDGRVLVQACDVADEAAVERTFAETVATLGRVDACFANAGVGGRSGGQGFVDMTTAEWRCGCSASTSTGRSSRYARRHATWWRARAVDRSS